MKNSDTQFKELLRALSILDKDSDLTRDECVRFGHCMTALHLNQKTQHVNESLFQKVCDALQNVEPQLLVVATALWEQAQYTTPISRSA